MNPFHQHVSILATGLNGELGFQNGLPWPSLKSDMSFFNRVTRGRTRNAVVMGRKTWQSLSCQPLKKRRNIVVSRDPDARSKYDIPEDVIVVNDFAKCADHMEGIDMCFVCGGAGLYELSLRSPFCRAVYHTLITPPDDIEADVFFKNVCKWKGPVEVFNVQEEQGYKLEFRLLDRGTKEATDEQQYLSLAHSILETGNPRADRTGVGTLSKFGAQMRFSLRGGVMPLLTTKNTFWRGLAIELLWFISGSTNAGELAAKGVHIWDANGSREFLDSRGLAGNEEGDLGPVYGFQWRHFGAKYVDMHTDYAGQGVDQLQNVIRMIKEDPTSRRIVMSAWNPADLGKMALPPCHMMSQFYVNDGELSCHLYCRSQDVALGTPFNIASYALLTHLIAHCCGLKAGELIHTIGDAHIYSNHVEQMQRQIQRQTFPFPRIIIDAETTDIDKIEYKHLKLRGYACHPAIEMKMAV
jgi:dihydrofolate reductase/thymidylate synthase